MTGVQPVGEDHPAAGLRIAAIRNYDASGKEILCRSFSYIDEAGKSSGRLLWQPIVYSQYDATSGGYGIERETLSSSSDFPYSMALISNTFASLKNVLHLLIAISPSLSTITKPHGMEYAVTRS